MTNMTDAKHSKDVQVGDVINLPYTERRSVVKLWKWLTRQNHPTHKAYKVTHKT
jgi:ribosomal 50S subunit-recycling heat shock protein